MWARGLVLVVALGACDQAFGLERDPPPRGDWRAVSAGLRFTCALKTDDTLWCWGSNENHQLGDEGDDRARPTQIGTASWKSISGRGEHVCGIQDDDTLWCWGNSNHGQVGTSVEGVVDAPTQVTNDRWSVVVTSYYNTCGIKQDSTLWCWGDNDHGEVGDGTTSRRIVPTAVATPTPDRWSSLAVGLEHACAIREDRSLWCWGQTEYGALGDPTIAGGQDQTRPIPVRGEFLAVAAGRYHTCAVTIDHRARCWGWNEFGQLGDGTTTPSPLPVVPGSDDDDWTDIHATYDHTCGTHADGTTTCWGRNTHGQIATPVAATTASQPLAIPAPVAPWSDRIALGLYHTCMIDEGDRLFCIGGNGAGQLGRDSGLHASPVQVGAITRTLAAGERFTCGLADNGDVSCWGDSYAGAIGDATRMSRQIPTAIDAAAPFDALVVGRFTACARRDAARWCWGSNTEYQMGIPTPLTILYLPKGITDGHFPTRGRTHHCEVTLAGGLFCWGPNANGQLGTGDNAPRSIPISIAMGVQWMHVGVGSYHTCGATTTQVYCWGNNDYYQLGDGTTVAQVTPKPIATANPRIDELAVGTYASCYRAGTEVSCWGGVATILGAGAPKTPTPIPGAWRSIGVSDDHACGVQTDGSLWCWGRNNAGKLGDGTMRTRMVPTRIGTDTDWDAPALGLDHTCARKTDGRVLCWGRNDNGEVGDGTSWSGELQQVD